MSDHVFSPTAPKDEIDGMKFAEEYFDKRLIFTAEGVRGIGNVIANQLVKRGLKSANFADGFRRMAYIISQTRKGNDEPN